ncbi:hypothetical protein DINM_021203 [Dirofilaria immitis]|nr:hypothetical protein [Dirofilaria immitis]
MLLQFAYGCDICLQEIYTYYFYYWLTCNFISDIVFLIDMFIQSRISYLHDGVAAENLKIQAIRYFHSYSFWLDIGSVFPFDFILIYRDDISLVRLNRLLKSYRFNYFIDRTEIRTNWPNAFKIFVLIMTCIVLFHWNAAAYFLISVISGIHSDDPDAWQFTYTKIADPVIPKCNTFSLLSDSKSCSFNESGRNVNNRLEYIDEMMQYWRNSKEYALSIYWSSLTLTTKGQQPYPMSSLEDALEVIDTLIGLLIFAVIIGSVGSIISTMNKEKSEFQDILDGIKFYMNYRKVNSDIQKRVLNCCDYIHDQRICKDERALLEGLPKKLHGELAVYLHMVTLQHVELLQDCEQGLLFELILRLKFQLFSPNDYICRRGELSREMYVVKRGQLSCVSDDGKTVLGILKEGAVFGQLAILNLSGKPGGSKHTVAIRSIGYTDVYVLRQEDVNDVLREYPLARRNLIQKAIKIHRSDGCWDNTVANEENVYGGASTLEEQLHGIEKSTKTLTEEINQLYEMFDNMSSDFKQRLTRLESAYKTRYERQKLRRKFVTKHKY